ncbi:MAG: hypothetical protein IJX87_04310 [Clostridia bacterium]|nr:hypothetical protein [Clostridia bacterium]
MDIYEKTQRFYQSAQTEKRVIGKSVFGRDLYAVKIGNGVPVAIAQYAIHGREFITAELAFEQAKIGIDRGSVWLIPLLNPDGCLLSETGLSAVSNREARQCLLDINGGNSDFSLWKANGRGVDLNVNFDADWGKGKKNVRKPAPENYIGVCPFSEPETTALRNFTREIRPDYTVSYHTKGEEIYWYFYQSIGAIARDKCLALELSRSTGYPLARAIGSAGGYKDWCIKKMGITAFTVEVGSDELLHPIRQLQQTDILSRNRYALRDLSNAWAQSRFLF